MKITKKLDWEPNFNNEIDIEDGDFTISLNKKEVYIECSWDYGYGGRGIESVTIPLDKLEQLIEELKNS